jgi:hypothetical protein
MSPGYALVVDWISEIWQELDQATIIRSFDQCGITAQNMANYGSQLRHFVRIAEHDDGDSWEQVEEDLELLDSDESENFINNYNKSKSIFPNSTLKGRETPGVIRLMTRKLFTK